MDRQYDHKAAKFSDLAGKTIVSVEGLEKGSERAKFNCASGETFMMTYYDDCCAHCTIEDVCGDVTDLIGPVVRAEESSNNKNPEDSYESQTWTFYILGTAKGTVTIRWYGSSNGCYSEAPTFELEVKGN